MVMLLAGKLSLKDLIELCRALRHNLDAGLTLRDVFRQQARRGPPAVRGIAGRISDDLEGGDSLEAALKRERRWFPPLFLSMAEVGERTGNLPDVFGEMEKFFILQQRLRRMFYAQIAWPIIQFLVAPFVIAGMIFVLAILSPGDKPFDPIGFGYTGVGGAMKFLVHWFGTIALIIVGYYVLTQALRQKAMVDAILLRVPVIGPCMRALAMARFCLALRLTMETGMSVNTALRLCMRATGNEAFVARTEVVRDAIRGGEDLTTALSRARVFPADFLDIMANAEEGGRVAESMRHQADYYDEESRRRMTILTTAAGFGLWVIVGGVLVFMIFRLFTKAYLEPINQLLQ
jgi:type II secretory pathway component PulF